MAIPFLANWIFIDLSRVGLHALGMTRKQVTPAKNPAHPVAQPKFAVPARIQIARYPLLKDLCWTGVVTELPARHAFAVYERNWRFVDRKQLKPRERVLLDGLMRKYGAGVINA
jgi:hypothetical protein